VSRQTKRQQITALAYDKRGKLLSVGRNSYTKTHPLQAYYADRTGRPGAVYLHAEIAALVKAQRPVHRLVVVRYGANGEPLLAAPCPSCAMAIRDFKVKHVEHT
jgi:tRNA(Arg) A34 adenosine deaminase TadA